MLNATVAKRVSAMSIPELFCAVDGFCKQFDPKMHQQLLMYRLMYLCIKKQRDLYAFLGISNFEGNLRCNAPSSAPHPISTRSFLSSIFGFCTGYDIIISRHVTHASNLVDTPWD